MTFIKNIINQPSSAAAEACVSAATAQSYAD